MKDFLKSLIESKLNEVTRKIEYFESKKEKVELRLSELHAELVKLTDLLHENFENKKGA